MRTEAQSPTTFNGTASPRITSSEPVFEIRDLSIAYRTKSGDVRAVHHVDLNIGQGEVVGLAGESGSGKSTLAYGACRLLRPPAVITSGSVLYRGRRNNYQPQDLLEMDRDQLQAMRWREISIVFQSAMNALNPVLRIQDQLADAIDVHLNLTKDEKLDKVHRVLDLVGIPRDRLRSYPHELSGGMRQRIMIAMALTVDPELVIMDEPTTALDVVVQREILSQIIELKERLGFSVLFITHDLSLMMELTDRLAIMYAGQLMEFGATSSLHRSSSHPYTKGLLNSFPSLRGPKRALAGIAGSTPDLRNLPPGCPFAPRCPEVRPACAEVDMTLRPTQTASGQELTHLTACPFSPPATTGIADTFMEPQSEVIQ